VAWTLSLSPSVDTNLIGGDPDGNGPLSANQHRVTATLSNPAATDLSGVPIRFTVTASGGSVSPSTGTATTNSSGIASSPTVTFTDSGDPGGSITVIACADIDGDTTCDAWEPTATATKYWVTASFSLSPTSTGESNAGPNNTTSDATATVSVTGPTGASLRVVLRITDSFPASGPNANGSFDACNDSDGTDVAPGSATPATAFFKSIYACDYVDDGTDDTFTVEAWWDVNNNNQVDSADVQIDNDETFTILDTGN